MALGMIYDLYGRKVPMLVFLLISCVAIGSLPFLQTETDLYLYAIISIPLPILISNPFVPDLVHEDSHGVANMLRTNTINVAKLCAYGLLLLNATNLPIFSSTVMFFSMTLLMVFTTLLVKIGMKDVIKEGGRMTESTSQ